MSGKERRRSPRYPVEDVSGTLHVSVPARILNLSVSGMAVEIGSPLRVGRSYSVRLRHDAEEEITLTGQVVWCHLRTLSLGSFGERKPIYEAGVSFENTLAPAATALLSFLERSAVLDANKRIFGRFRVAGDPAVSFAAEHEFVARTISATGMLLETDFAAEIGTQIETEIHLDGEVATVKARIAFARDTQTEEGSRVSELGIEYVNPQPEEKDKITAFISRLLT